MDFFLLLWFEISDSRLQYSEDETVISVKSRIP